MTEPDQNQATFEAALGRLDAIVRQLEDGDLSLDDAIARFEEGLALLKTCRSRLETAELRVKELLASGELADLSDE